METQMKTLVMMAVFALTATSSFASSVSCSTNVNRIQGVASTSIVVHGQGNTLEATLVTQGGLAQFVTAPVSFPVQATQYGPEVVQYTNNDKGFMLEVIFQPINGVIHGTYTFESEGRRVQTPVICGANQ